MPTAALALVKRMLGKGGAPPPELAPYWDSLREVVATRGEAAMHDIMRFDTSNLADLADRLAPGERDAAFPLRFGEGTATWETAVKAMGGWEMEEAGWVAMGWAAGRAEATGAPA